MPHVYSISRSNTALSVVADILTITAAAGRSLRIIDILIGGMATASAPNELIVQRSTGGATATTQTPERANPNSPAAAFTAATAWATQPTLLGGPVMRIPVNANGGAFRWGARPGQEIEVPGGGQVSLRSAVGTSNVTITVFIEEF